uniref:hypothetical protein n=1 Tax=Muricoccus aerilatus TaxID=452982 RepID=UPI001B8006AA
KGKSGVPYRSVGRSGPILPYIGLKLGPCTKVALGVIIEAMAQTPAGRAAKAEVAMTLVQSNLAGEALSKEDAMLWSLAEDAAGKPLFPPP